MLAGPFAQPQPYTNAARRDACALSAAQVLELLRGAVVSPATMHVNFVGSTAGIVCRRCRGPPAAHPAVAKIKIWEVGVSSRLNVAFRLFNFCYWTFILFFVMVIAWNGGRFGTAWTLTFALCVVAGAAAMTVATVLFKERLVFDPVARRVTFNGNGNATLGIGGTGAWSCSYEELPAMAVNRGQVVLRAPRNDVGNATGDDVELSEYSQVPEYNVAHIVGAWDVWFAAATQPVAHPAAKQYGTPWTRFGPEAEGDGADFDVDCD
jgi:hypothetical protein